MVERSDQEVSDLWTDVWMQELDLPVLRKRMKQLRVPMVHLDDIRMEAQPIVEKAIRAWNPEKALLRTYLNARLWSVVDEWWNRFNRQVSISKRAATRGGARPPVPIEVELGTQDAGQLEIVDVKVREQDRIDELSFDVLKKSR